MTRETIDCRKFGGDCTVAISADTKDELLKAAMEHAVKEHGHQDTAEFRGQLVGAMEQVTV
jgi:predicted small metal-binding protein